MRKEEDTAIKGLIENVEKAWKELKGDGDELKTAQDAFVADVEKAIKLDEKKDDDKKEDETKEGDKTAENAGTEDKPAEAAAATKARRMRLMRARKLAMASKMKKTKPVIRKSYKH